MKTHTLALAAIAALSTACGVADQAAKEAAAAEPTPAATPDGKPTVRAAGRVVETVKPDGKDDLVAHLYQDVSAFPACDADRQGALAFATATKTIYVCDAAKWAEVQGLAGKDGAAGAAGAAGAKGERGEKGERGDTGLQGAAGTNGTDAVYGIAKIYDCSALGSVWTYDATQYLFDYQAVTYRNGEVRVSVSVNEKDHGRGFSRTIVIPPGDADGPAGRIKVHVGALGVPGTDPFVEFWWEVGYPLRARQFHSDPNNQTGTYAPGPLALTWTCNLRTF